MSWICSSLSASPRAPRVLFLLMATCFLTACPQGIDPSEVEERCSDGLDNNGDDLVDCADPTCALFPSCTGNEHCYNGVDDNGDGLIDCEEESCKALFICLEDIEDCINGRDDDHDGKTDCQDSACAETSVCKPGAEACSGGIDEDNDGQIDCDDEDCKAVFFCLATIELPGNQLDDDGDGQVDCEDPDIARTSACLDGGELCDDSLDNDGDGLLDCADPDCSSTSSCLFPAEVCDNGVDDDNDGDIDCQDTNCAGSPRCRDELCDDGVDNDGDGLIDCQDTQDCSPTLHVCLRTAEECTNQRDDDGDGLTDCEDSDCVDHSSCALAEACDNQLDDDGDGLTDCLDPDCADVSTCQCPVDSVGTPLDCVNPLCANIAYCQCEGTRPEAGAPIDCEAQSCQDTYPDCNRGLLSEICGDLGVDNDGDGYTDCEDVDCSEQNGCPQLACTYSVTYFERLDVPDCQNSACLQLEEECASNVPDEFCAGDGVDNDGDLAIDCEDSDCALDPICQCPLLDGAPDCGDPRCADTDACICEASIADNTPWGPRPDCTLTACQNIYAGCRTGQPAEICDGFGVDNDQSDGADCADPACITEPACACPLDMNGVPLDCSVPSCQALDYCACAATIGANGQIDCSALSCQNQYLDCRTDLPTEACGTFSIDNDGDGYIDCEDIDCSDVGVCPPLLCAQITNPLDMISAIPDCSDNACIQSSTTCQTGLAQELCNGDGVDNDGDGSVDCEDADCSGASICQCPVDAQNTPIDCSDTRCANEDYCLCEAARAANAGQIDCNVTSCQAIHTDCGTGLTTEVCGTLDVDNDDDGYTDCEDMDCWGVGSCPTPICPKTLTYYELTNVPDCQTSACQQTEPACFVGQTTEFCEGGGVDNDDNGATDCEDPACSGAAICQCPVDAQNIPIDCSDVRCANEDYCLCVTLSPVRPMAIPGSTLADCSIAQCQSDAPECQTGLAVESCNGDGVDNDGDGLIDCDDPDCHDFLDNNAYCTRALCGDPLNNYLVEEVDTSATENFVITNAASLQSLSDDLPGAPTLLRGDIAFISSGNAYDLPASNLRCVLPGNTTSGQVLVDGPSINGRSGFEKLAVIQELTLLPQPSGQEFNGFVALAHVLGDLEVIEPSYTSTQNKNFNFTGLTNLRRIGGNLSLVPNDANIDTNNGLFDFEGTRVSFSNLMELVEVGANFGNVNVRDTFVYPPLHIPGSGGCAWTFLADSESPFEPAKGQADGGYLVVDSFHGLQKLRRIGGDLCVSFEATSTSTTFVGLDSLEAIGGSLGIGSNQPYRYVFPSIDLSFDGLQKLKTIGEDLYVEAGSGSTDSVYLYSDYSGLTHLTTIGRHFITLIQNNFNDFSGLGMLSEVGGQFHFYSDFGSGSHASKPFEPLSAIQSIGGNLFLGYTNTVSLGGLQGLSNLGGFAIVNNESLTDISQLSGILSLSNGDLYIINNEILDDFAGITQVTLVSGHVSFNNINAFNMVNNIQTIGKNLMASYVGGLNNFSMMTNLTSIGGLVLTQCDGLDSLTGLPAMTTFTHDLKLDAIDQLSTDLSLLNTLQVVQGNVELRSGLLDTNFLSSLTQIGGTLSIENNNQLSSLDGLNNLVRIGHDLRIQSNSILGSLSGFTSLVTIVHDLSIYYNNALIDLTGLDNLTTLRGSLFVTSNQSLSDTSSLFGVSNISPTTDITFQISNNASLCSTQASDLYNHWISIGFGGTANMTNNTGSVCP